MMLYIQIFALFLSQVHYFDLDLKIVPAYRRTWFLLEGSDHNKMRWGNALTLFPR